MSSLCGKRIIVTRAADQAGEFSRVLEERGATVIECPTIELYNAEPSEELEMAVNSIETFDWLLLTSANAVRFFFELLDRKGKDSRSLAACKVCVVGPKTAELLMAKGILPDLMPENFDGEGVVEAFKKIGVKGARVFFPRADKARDVIPKGLQMMGAEVVSPVLYFNRAPESLPVAVIKALENREIDIITFSASSTVTNLAELIGGKEKLCTLLEGVTVASIGPVTSRSCRDIGLKVDTEPERSTLAALVDAIEGFCERKTELEPV